MTWHAHLRADPLPWLLGEDTPAVRAATLQRLLDRPADAPEVRAARAAAMAVDPIRSILDAQDPAGWWAKPGPGYGPKYRGTVWQLIFLDQLGADPDHPRWPAPASMCWAGARPPAAGSAARRPRPSGHRRRPG